MKTLITGLVTKILWILVLPFIFFFGHFNWFQEIMVIVADLIDTIGLFYLLFIIVVAITLYRNFSFQIFNKIISKCNNLSSACVLSIICSSINKFFIAIGTKIKNFFKKK